MSVSTLAAPTVDTVGQTAASTAELLKRGKIRETAQKFEASFLSVMMQSMTASMKTPEVGGGGTGEDMFKSLLAEEMAKQVSKAGGIGVAAAVQKEMLKMQGLKE
ncbi:rod-binding protein [Caulobacter sp. BK020]|uniref:rod-binding protein n=1 Tax=Caulobacter sp. BK020 TaxID=2512117 RepID=UPI0010CF2266|nr:rod-binding protein [Caulobacter sp. BK020]TCS14072.1 rod binding protein [Caulobacter sp. BK020]